MFRGKSGGRSRGSSFNPEFAPLWPGYTARRGREEENEQITQDEGGGRVQKLCPGYPRERKTVLSLFSVSVSHRMNVSHSFS